MIRQAWWAILQIDAAAQVVLLWKVGHPEWALWARKGRAK